MELFRSASLNIIRSIFLEIPFTANNYNTILVTFKKFLTLKSLLQIYEFDTSKFIFWKQFLSIICTTE